MLYVMLYIYTIPRSTVALYPMWPMDTRDMMGRSLYGVCRCIRLATIVVVAVAVILLVVFAVLL